CLRPQPRRPVPWNRSLLHRSARPGIPQESSRLPVGHSASVSWVYLAVRQEFRWIHRLALLPYLKVQLDRVGIGVPHFSNCLPPAHLLALLHEDGPVVGIGRQQAVTVLHNDEITISADAATGIHHFSSFRSQHLLSGAARDVDALVLALVELGHHAAV